jgi:hypothetical protein
MKINRSLKIIMSMGIMGINSVAIAADNSADITALQTEIKNLKTSIANLTDMMRNQSAQATQINELKTRMNSINSSQNLELANLEKRAVIGNTSCYNLRKNPKTKVYTIGSTLDINDGEYLLCGVLSTGVAFFKNGVTAVDYILHANDIKNPLLRFTKLGNTYVQEYKHLNGIKNKILSFNIFRPYYIFNHVTRDHHGKYVFNITYSGNNVDLNSYEILRNSSDYHEIKFDFSLIPSPETKVTLYVLNINDI